MPARAGPSPSSTLARRTATWRGESRPVAGRSTSPRRGGCGPRPPGALTFARLRGPSACRRASTLAAVAAAVLARLSEWTGSGHRARCDQLRRPVLLDLARSRSFASAWISCDESCSDLGSRPARVATLDETSEAPRSTATRGRRLDDRVMLDPRRPGSAALRASAPAPRRGRSAGSRGSDKHVPRVAPSGCPARARPGPCRYPRADAADVAVDLRVVGLLITPRMHIVGEARRRREQPATTPRTARRRRAPGLRRRCDCGGFDVPFRRVGRESPSLRNRGSSRRFSRFDAGRGVTVTAFHWSRGRSARQQPSACAISIAGSSARPIGRARWPAPCSVASNPDQGTFDDDSPKLDGSAQVASSTTTPTAATTPLAGRRRAPGRPSPRCSSSPSCLILRAADPPWWSPDVLCTLWPPLTRMSGAAARHPPARDDSGHWPRAERCPHQVVRVPGGKLPSRPSLAGGDVSTTVLDLALSRRETATYGNAHEIGRSSRTGCRGRPTLRQPEARRSALARVSPSALASRPGDDAPPHLDSVREVREAIDSTVWRKAA